MQPGSRLGPYEIVAPLGAGGMGEVWRARDTRLGREVAVKVLPPRLAGDADALARFEREARSVAALSHPGIVALHDVGRENGTAFLVMELLAGESLGARLNAGPLPLAEAVRIATDVAEALAAAHRQGVVHRDLKPGNVMLTRRGTKLLDFGLAKQRPAITPATASDDWTHLPTAAAGEQTPLTAEGSLLGTLQYMAPEQLEGREADARSDLFAFGAMLYEMVSGRRAFSGSTPASVIAAILREEPRPLVELVPMAPAVLDRLVRRCLAKDPEERWQSAADVAEALRWIGQEAPGSGPLTGAEATAARPSARRSAGKLIAALLATGLLVAVGVLAGVLARRARQSGGVVNAALAVPPGAVFVDLLEPSPDGRQLAFIAFDRQGAAALWVQDVATAEARQLAGTSGATQPFWSPDGRFLGFFAGGKMAKIALAGGPPTVLADAPDPYGASWSERGTIVYAPQTSAGVFAVPATGGTARPVTALQADEEAHRWPAFIDDGERFVFLADTSVTATHRLRLGSLAGGPLRPLLDGFVSNVRFVPPDSLLFVRNGALLEQRFDFAAARPRGEPNVLAADLVMAEGNHRYEMAAVPGLLTYRNADPQTRFVWVDRRGEPVEPVGQPGLYGEYELSPDRRWLAYESNDSDRRRDALWVRDLQRGTSTKVATTNEHGVVSLPVFLGDSGGLAFGFGKGLFQQIFFHDLGRSEASRPLVPGKGYDTPFEASADGSFLIFDRAVEGDLSANLWIYPLPGGPPRQWAAAVGVDERDPAISPDSRWIAYSSDRTGVPEIYVESVEQGAPPIQVSVGGGIRPQWSGGAREIVYLDLRERVMSVAMRSTAAGGFDPAPPSLLFSIDSRQHSYRWLGGRHTSIDGERFLLIEQLANPQQAPLRMVIGWQPAR